MSSSTPRRAPKQQPSASSAPPPLQPQSYFPHMPMSAQASLQYPATQFQHFPPPPQHPQHIEPQLPPQQPQQPQASPQTSRKRKAPGTAPANVPTVSPTMGGDATAMGQAMNQQMNPQMGQPMGPPMGQPMVQSLGQQTESGNETATQVPAPKKSRTNTPWGPAEEHKLRVMRDAGNSWGEIAKSFPNRTEGSVKKHWYKDMHFADFAEDEVSTPDPKTGVPLTLTTQSQQLLDAIKDYEANKWKVIGQKVGKPAKACEQYAKEHFKMNT